ncbi:hypothetical protein Asppvi_009990 [Aspergillus pseudoviridinutans]|uniref:CHAT domain-containing protein n=1 Tax=Aspergillus pseudoviridinutans TaxID=1517512 RepID=A0A9P3BGX8_9EURO|nr:uncharacterized protein Asppvi_009990 [Aspergillus pseudoviridinutans]GIJ91025.1 hypothetical protein Asppvi_009990 [Aspergillus pseudoviridinutans]
MPRTVGLNPLATEKEVELVTRPSKFTLHDTGYQIEDRSAGSLFLAKSTKKGPQRLTVRDLAELRHSVAQITYLSACSTAENSSIDLANEVIHIASAFQLLGFPHAIGTLWEADNQCATEVAGTFYRNLIEQLKESGPDVSHDVVAYALHLATMELRRKKPGNVIGWAPFIRIGA